ncbi:MAG: hypothetical protein U0Q15_00130 [Kineosporiaceae bacterium]
MSRLRPWALWLSLLAVLLATLTSVGASWLVGPPDLSQRVQQVRSGGAGALPSGIEASDLDALDDIDADAADPPGLGIPALALVNGLLLVVLGLTALPLLVGSRATGLTQGVVSLVAGIVGIVVGIVLAVVAFVALTLMVSLFLSAPFGTLAYLAVFGFFDTGTGALLLGVIMVLQLAAAVLLVVAHQRFLQSKGLVLLVLTALLLTFVTGLLQSVVPGILVSITDAVAALVSAVVGVVWGLFVLVGGVVSVVKLLSARQGGGRTTERAPA